MKRLFIILFVTLLAVGCSKEKIDDGGTQPNAEIAVSAEELAFYASGDAKDTEQLQITSSEKWRLSGKKTWCRPSAIEGESGETITFEVDPNLDSEPRSIVYSFICASRTKKVVITQQASSVLDFKTPTTIDVAVGGGQISVIVNATSDMTYSIAESCKNWIRANTSRAVNTNFLSFTVDSNPTFAPRPGAIIFSVDGKEQSVTINQAQTNKVSIPVVDYAVDPEGAEVTVNYTANVDIVPILTEYPWITLISNNASVSLSPGELKFAVEPAKNTRMAKIPVKSADGLTTYATLTFSQAAAPVTTIVPDAEFSKWLKAQGFVVATAESNKYELTSTGLAVSSFNVAGKSIRSLVGIEAFETLTTLDCSNNYLTSINLSMPNKINKLNCETNDIKVLNLSGCAPFANAGISSSYALRMTYNNLEEVYLSDNCAVEFGVAGADRLKGRSGVSSTTLKLVGKAITRILCGNANSLVTVDVTGCPAMVKFSGGRTGSVRTVYVTAEQKKLADASSISWELPNGGSFVVK